MLRRLLPTGSRTVAAMPASPSLQARFGTAVRTARAALGISQEELAHRSGVARTYIGELERGRRCPTLCTAEDVAHGLNMELEQLLLAARDLDALFSHGTGNQSRPKQQR